MNCNNEFGKHCAKLCINLNKDIRYMHDMDFS